MSDIIATMTVDGKLPSMRNQRRIVTNRKTGKPFSIKSQEALDYAEQFLLKIPHKYRLNYDGPVSLRVRVWYPSRRNDLDIEYLKDLIAKAGIIKNDRQVMHMEAWKGLCRDNPRVVFTVYRHDEDTAVSHTIAPQSLRRPGC